MSHDDTTDVHPIPASQGMLRDTLTAIRGDLASVRKTQLATTGDLGAIKEKLGSIAERLDKLESKGTSSMSPVVLLLIGAILSAAVPPMLRAVAAVEAQPVVSLAPAPGGRHTAAAP